jgi:hypothetical protein
MKPDQLYQHLKELAEKLDITVSEQNFRITGIKVKSGLCKVKGKNLFVMDKHRSTRDKIEILADTLTQFPLEDIYIIPSVREKMIKLKKKS